MPPNPRVSNAFRAMREIGIIEEKVKPVLKNLLKLYDKNWQLIEEENYRALADAIFEQEESQVEEQKRVKERADVYEMEEEAQVHEEPEQPLKRLRKNQEGQASPSVGNASSKPNGTLLKQPKQEGVEVANETQLRSCSQKVIEPIQLSTEETSEGSHPMSCPPLVRKKGKQPMLPGPSSDVADKTLALVANEIGSDAVSPTTHRRGKGKEPISYQSPPSSDRSTRAVCLKEPKVEPGTRPLLNQQAKSTALTKPKDEPVTDDGPDLSIPLAAIHPEPLDAENSSLLSDSVIMPDCPDPLISQTVQDGVRNDGMPDSSKNEDNNRGTLPMVDESLSKLEMVSQNNREETINLSPAMDIQEEQNGASDALDVTDKTTGPDNGSFNSRNVNDAGQTLVPMHTTSSNGNNCNKTLKDTDVVDIANGQERIVISFANEVNDESPPPFRYIPQNVVYQNAYINCSLARIGENCCSTCLGDCLSSSTPCACAYETGGEYAYTSEGLVKEHILKESILMNRDPENQCQVYCENCPLERSKNDGVVEKCKGHLVRKFIKECWWKCGCDNNCGNRVVQRGISRKLQVFMTPEGKGWGLRSLEDLPEGAFVCEYVGEILTNAELFDRVSQKSSDEVHSYPVLLDADWGAEGVLKDEEALCLDATHYGNVARFVNHRCEDSNMVEIPVEVETPDHHYYHLAFFTTRKVKALEELTWDYGINFDDKAHPVKAFKCRCGSRLCRNIKRPNRKVRYGRRRR